MSLSVCETGGISKEKYDILLSIFEDWNAENPQPQVVVSILKSFAKAPDLKPMLKNQENSTKVEESEDTDTPIVVKLEDDDEEGQEEEQLQNENDEFNHQDTNSNNNNDAESQSQSDHHERNEEEDFSPVVPTENNVSQENDTQSTTSSSIDFDQETESQVEENEYMENNQTEVAAKRVLRSDLNKTTSSGETVLEKKYKSSITTNPDEDLTAPVSSDSPLTLFRSKMKGTKIVKSSSSSKQRVTCSHCLSTYAGKSGLTRHQRFSCPSSIPEYNRMTTLTRRLKTEGNWW